MEAKVARDEFPNYRILQIIPAPAGFEVTWDDKGETLTQPAIALALVECWTSPNLESEPGQFAHEIHREIVPVTVDGSRLVPQCGIDEDVNYTGYRPIGNK